MRKKPPEQGMLKAGQGLPGSGPTRVQGGLSLLDAIPSATAPACLHLQEDRLSGGVDTDGLWQSKREVSIKRSACLQQMGQRQLGRALPVWQCSLWRARGSPRSCPFFKVALRLSQIPEDPFVREQLYWVLHDMIGSTDVILNRIGLNLLPLTTVASTVACSRVELEKMLMCADFWSCLRTMTAAYLGWTW